MEKRFKYDDKKVDFLSYEFNEFQTLTRFCLLQDYLRQVFYIPGKGKSLSEALIFASINPQYDNRLFMELP